MLWRGGSGPAGAQAWTAPPGSDASGKAAARSPAPQGQEDRDAGEVTPGITPPAVLAQLPEPRPAPRCYRRRRTHPAPEGTTAS